MAAAVFTNENTGLSGYGESADGHEGGRADHHAAAAAKGPGYIAAPRFLEFSRQHLKSGHATAFICAVLF